MQFAKLDIFDSQNLNYKNQKPVRNWKNFSKREFQEELLKINWKTAIPSNIDANASTQVFYEKITKLLDEMAPFKKPTKKEVKLRQSPWITLSLIHI